MRTSAVEYMKKLASSKLKLKDVEFIDFESIDLSEEGETTVGDNDNQSYEAQIDVEANLRLKYEGELPDSYRVLNGMIQDWVDEHESDLKKMINPKLISFLKDHYKNIDVSDLQEDFDDYIWEDQVDYLPEVDEEKKEIVFMLEMVLDLDEEEDSDE